MAFFTGKITSSWWANQDSNLGPSGYEPEALPTELLARTMFEQGNIAPADGPVNYRRAGPWIVTFYKLVISILS